MITEEIRSLYDYTTWGNQRILEIAAQLTEEQFLENVSPSQGSLRNVLVHTMGGQWIWLERWNGRSPKKMLNRHEYRDLAAIREHWNRIDEDTLRFLSQLAQEQLEQSIKYVDTGGNSRAFLLWKLMIHQVNHATQHRSEAAEILTHLGHSPGDLDLVVYYSSLE